VISGREFAGQRRAKNVAEAAKSNYFAVVFKFGPAGRLNAHTNRNKKFVSVERQSVIFTFEFELNKGNIFFVFFHSIIYFM
jgi:hypothetical protein